MTASGPHGKTANRASGDGFESHGNGPYPTTGPTDATGPYRTAANRRLVGLRGVYREGLPLAGWGCGRCYRNFPHSGRRQLTFARFVLHHIGKHGRFPRYLMPPARLLRLRWTVIPADERAAVYRTGSPAKRHPRLWQFFVALSTAGTARVTGLWRDKR